MAGGFNYYGNGAPGIGVPNPGSVSPSSYLDKQNGVVYVNSGQGWKEDLFSAADALTAHAGGGQASALPITTQMARFTVVGTAADSAVLPSAVPGMSYTVSNAAAASMNVFPATGEIINALSANAAFAVAAGKTCEFVCMKAGQWHTLLSA
jgi:hypothetical protein